MASLGSRSPCGERGLKWRPVRPFCCRSESLPVRGAWIEIVRCKMCCMLPAGRSPCGERGLKCPVSRRRTARAGRSPCGERGLKSPWGRRSSRRWRSLPVRGAWIEILLAAVISSALPSLPVRGAWIEISTRTRYIFGLRCRSPCGERGLKFLCRFEALIH